MTTQDESTSDAARQLSGEGTGKAYWRSLEELSRTETFEELMHQEFPQQAQPLGEGVDRRDFVKLMGASMAMAGLAACGQPNQTIVPYVKQPEDLIPGKPIFFASAFSLGGVGTGVLVESHMGRPTKIEGNPDHPGSLGATDPYMQASVLGLYDPDRSQVVRHLGEISTYSEFIGAIQPLLTTAKTNGAGLRLLTQTVTSPTLGAQIQTLLAQYRGMKWHQWEPVSGHNVREGGRLAFGTYVNSVYHYDKANVIVALDSDFLGDGPGHLRHARDFASRRRVRKGVTTSMNRLYAIESGASNSGSMADHRLLVKPSEVEAIARAIAAGVGLSATGGTTDHANWIGPLVKDLMANRGASIVVAGESQPAMVHAIAHAINSALGNIGSTITITDPIEVSPANQLESLRELVADMNAGVVNALFILGGNPVFDAPADFNFTAAMQKVPFRAHLSHYYDETSLEVQWHIPEVHYLESWSDTRAYDGTVSIQQPLIAPLYNGRSAHEILGALIGGLDQPPYDAVRSYWSGKAGALGFDNAWRKWLSDGVMTGSALPARAGAASMAIPAPQPAKPGGQLELRITHDPTIFDGRFGNNGWLQELPKPQTKITWENVLIVSPKTARDLGIGDKERAERENEKETWLVDLDYRGKSTTLPIWVLPGHADGVASVSLGYGRERGGRIAGGNAKFIENPFEGDPVGVNIYPLRTSDALYGGPGATVRVKSSGYRVGCTQEHQSLDPKVVQGDRGIIREATFSNWLKNPAFAQEEEHEEGHGEESMYPPVEYKQYAWGMVIDTSVCTGCQGCVIACQSENNIAIVGKDQVWRERELHWLRIDRYYKGDPANPEVYHQPVPCMQCENAPCEPVCPVEATSHSSDGLNDMTYNRCVGTRYCSNNCPYKVRRFNFYHYSDYDTPSLKPMRNPDVTVRTRGVMEKCTYCVQRVNEAKIEAEKQDRPVRDGEWVTACQQACPTEAIVVGNLNDKESRVAKLRAEPTNYALLAELNTKPRTTYLATVRNPNPEIKEA
jgi:MoCo/4Fe-4S cofactor protein with predicted Tat translocation signal